MKGVLILIGLVAWGSLATLVALYWCAEALSLRRRFAEASALISRQSEQIAWLKAVVKQRIINARGEASDNERDSEPGRAGSLAHP